MNKFLLSTTLFYVFLCFSLLSSCSSSDDDDLVGNWTRCSDFEGVARGYAGSFVIGRKAYVVGGFGDKNKRLRDTWEFDFDGGYWTQRSEFGGIARNSAASFASDSKGYVGTGYDGENYLKDFWEFDPVKNEWTQKEDFGGSSRHGALGFYVNGAGYMGTGYDGNYLMDFYKYDPAADEWENYVSIQGTKRAFASSFIIDDKVYVVGGLNNGSNVTDFWMLDPGSKSWIQKEYITNTTDYDFDDEYTTIARLNAVTFVIDGLGYLVTGERGGTISNTWEYHPDTDRWREKSGFEGSARTGAVGFCIDNRAFVLTGSSGSYYFDDMWEFKPWEEYDAYK